MIVDKYTTMNIRLSQEECSVLERAIDILRNINREIDNSDADEVRLSDNIDKNLLNTLENELDTIDF
jgi:hypothetical protein